jgi:hypothetical protein
MFSVNTTDWGTVQDSICGDATAVEVDDQQRIAVDAENQYNQLYNSTQNPSGAPNVNSNENGSYLPGGYANNDCDESDYGEILVNQHECDAVSTVTPATFAQREPRMIDFSHYNESSTSAACNQTAITTDAGGSPIADGCAFSKSKKRRKFLIGGLVFVAMMLVVVVITVPVVLTKSRTDAQVASAEKGDAGAPVENLKEVESDDAGLDEAGLNFNSTSGESSSYEQNEPTDYTSAPDSTNDYDVKEPAGGEINIPSASLPAGSSSNLSVPASDEAPQPESPTSPIGSPSGYNAAMPSMISDTSPPFANTPVPVSTSTNSNNAGSPTNLFSSFGGSSIPTSSDNSQGVPSNSVVTDSPISSPLPPSLEPTKFTESVVKISLQTDKQGYETSWTLEAIDLRNSNSSTVIASVDENTYSSYEKDSKTLTLPRGAYRFTLRDSFGDGFCCKDFEGYYKIKVDGVEIIKGGYYRSEISYTFLIGHFPEMTDREKQWLEAHNVRRMQWHEGNGVSYVPLKWSAELAKHAQAWADKLTEKCEIVGIDHEHDVEEGENLAKNQADGRNGMGRLYPPDNIVRRWVDYEADLPNPKNLHLTQALWRATKYVGCADATREGEDGYVCRVQVCRYAKAGNCQLGKYNASDGDNWLVPMLMDDTPCGPECPPEGCF